MFHRSAKGKVVNFDEMVMKNATTVAAGNANLNARGDLLGKNGQIIQTAEQRNAGTTTVVSTARASIQSEISALQAARQNWQETVQAVPVDPTIEIDTTDQSETKIAAKKPRNITESE